MSRRPRSAPRSWDDERLASHSGYSPSPVPCGAGCNRGRGCLLILMSFIRAYTWGSERCFWCDRRVTYAKDQKLAPGAATRDHLVPRARGISPDGGQNTVVSCRRCNQRRGASSNWVWLVRRRHPKREEVLRYLHARLPRFAYPVLDFRTGREA